MKKIFILLAIVNTYLFSAHSAFAIEKSDFNVAYKEYNASINKNDWKNALPAAKKAYLYGQELFGKEAEKTLFLHYNFAYSLLKNKQREAAKVELLAVLDAFRRTKGAAAEELVAIYLDLGRVTENPLNYYKKGLNISKKVYGENSLEHIQNLSDVGSLLLNINNNRSAGKYLRKANSILMQHVDKDTIFKGMLLFDLGKYELIFPQRYSLAAEYFEQSITEHERAKTSTSQHALITRAYLVRAYEELGLRENATKHCIQIGKQSALNENSEYLPIHKKAPIYPALAAQRGHVGSVIVEYEVDRLGFTRNHRIIESSQESLNQASIEAAKAFRYAPKYVDGQAVIAENVRNKFKYSLN